MSRQNCNTYFAYTHRTSQVGSMRALVEWAFSQYSRVLVVRVDFGYKKICPGISYEQVWQDMRRYLRSMRDCALFDNLVGMAWKLEYASSFHYHTLWFFNGHEHQQHAYIADQLGERWGRLTEKRGIAHNCNQDIRKYRNIGIGMIHRDDETARQNLLQVAMYLCKEDGQAKKMVPAGHRTFGRTILRGHSIQRKGGSHE